MNRIAQMTDQELERELPPQLLQKVRSGATSLAQIRRVIQQAENRGRIYYNADGSTVVEWTEIRTHIKEFDL